MTAAFRRRESECRSLILINGYADDVMAFARLKDAEERKALIEYPKEHH
jgi:hypothetical protein